MEEIEPQKQQLTCPLHKRQVIVICLDLSCSLNRLACLKCLESHLSHENALMEATDWSKSLTLQKIIAFNHLGSEKSSSFPSLRGSSTPLDILGSLDMLSTALSQIKQQIGLPASSIDLFNADASSTNNREDQMEQSLKNYVLQIKSSEKALETNSIHSGQLKFCLSSLQAHLEQSPSYTSSLPSNSKCKPIIQKPDKEEDSSSGSSSCPISNPTQKEQMSKKAGQQIIRNPQKSTDFNLSDQTISKLEAQHSLFFTPLLKELPKTILKVPIKLPASTFTANFDGSCKGNPGLSGAGVVIYYNNRPFIELAINVGIRTNNQSEYLGIIYLFYVCHKFGIQTIHVCGDSQLVINHLNGTYKVSSASIMEYYQVASQLMRLFSNPPSLKHVLRNENARADKLSNEALTSNFPRFKVYDDIPFKN